MEENLILRCLSSGRKSTMRSAMRREVLTERPSEKMSPRLKWRGLNFKNRCETFLFAERVVSSCLDVEHSIARDGCW